MASAVIESLRRLYAKDSLTEEQLNSVKESADRLLQTKKITIKEYYYILGKDGENNE